MLLGLPRGTGDRCPRPRPVRGERDEQADQLRGRGGADHQRTGLRRRGDAQAGAGAEQAGAGQGRDAVGVGRAGQHQQRGWPLAQGAGEGGAEGVGDDDGGVGFTQAAGERGLGQGLAGDLHVRRRGLGDEDWPGRVGVSRAWSARLDGGGGALSRASTMAAD